LESWKDSGWAGNYQESAGIWLAFTVVSSELQPDQLAAGSYRLRHQQQKRQSPDHLAQKHIAL
jgi:hypothetical protein